MQVLELNEITKIKTGKLDANAAVSNGDYPFFTCAQEPLLIDKYDYDCECVLVAGNGDLNVKYYNGKFNAYQRTYIIESIDTNKLNPKYLYYFMDKYVNRLRTLSIGGIIKYIKLCHLKDAKILLPSITEQERVVTILDKAENIRKKRQKTIEELDNLLRAAFLDMFGDPITNSKNLHELQLSEIINSIDSGKSPVCLDREVHDNEYGVLKLSAISSDYFNDIYNKAILPGYAPDKRHVVKGGDLLFSRKNTYELVGATALVFETKMNLLLPDLIFRFNVNEKLVCKEYLWCLLTDKGIKTRIRGLATGASGSMPNISKAKLKNLVLPIADIKQQKNFVNLFNRYKTYKDLYKKQFMEYETLFKSIMQRAFNGELSNG